MTAAGADVVVIGAGANGLAAAALLAAAGRRVVVVERREAVGGTLATEEFHPGFRANVCRDDTGWIAPEIERLLGDGARPREVPAGLVVAGDGVAPFATSHEVGATAASLAGLSRADAARWGDFCSFVTRLTGFLEAVYAARPPRVQSRAPGDLLALASLGRRLRGLGRREMVEVLRAVPMPIADLLDEWFQTPALKGALSAIGIRDVLHGPLSSGTALVFFHHHVGLPAGHIGGRRAMAGGTGALVDALATAARRAGARIELGQDVAAIDVRDGRVAGVHLQSGGEIGAPTVVASPDPRRVFSFVDPVWLDPALLAAVDHVRMRGATARVHFALDGFPGFARDGRAWPDGWLRGAIALAPDVLDLERAYDAAKYGHLPERPAMCAVLPTIDDPSLAPAGRHVCSVAVHHVPHDIRGGWTAATRDALGSLVEQRLAALAPGFRERIVARWVLAPPDLAERFAVTEGSLTHGEVALDQMLFMRPVPDCARYATPLPGLWLCGAGTHPANGAGASGVLAARELLRRAPNR